LACGSSCASVIETSPVDQQVVQLAPVDVLEELPDRLVQHRAAPGDRLVLLVEEELDRDRLDAADRVERQDLALRRDHRTAVNAEHARNRVAPDVGVQRGGPVSVGDQRSGQVGGDGGLADAALAGPYADDVLHRGERPLREPALAAEPLGQALLLLVGEDVEPDGDRLDAQRLDALDDGLLEMRADRAAGSGERDDHVDPPLLGLLDGADHPEGDDVLAQLGVDDLAQRVLDLFTGGHRHR
jgi:hypothetical protein